MQCQAKSKRTGEQCKQPAVTGKRVCRFHGGLTPGGMASVHFKHGRYSKYLPERLQERYQESLKDPELLALGEEIALTDSRLEDLIHRVDSGESGEAWQQAKRAFDDLADAIHDQNAGAMAAALTNLDRIIKRGLADYAAWGEIGNMMEQRRRLVESERKRRVDMQQMISTERAMILISAITDVIRRNVTDRKQLSQISRELVAILSDRQKQDQEAQAQEEVPVLT